MATKRKRSSVSKKRNKRLKSAPSEDWPAKDILEERLKDGALQYLVDWEGVDPKTNRPWEPDWLPADYANDLLVAAWEIKKASIAKEELAAREVRRLVERSSPVQSSFEPRSRPLHRPRIPRIIESSFSLSSLSSLASTPAETAIPNRSTPEPPGSPSSTAVTESPAGPLRPSPQVQLYAHASFDPNQYDPFSQLAPFSTSISLDLRRLPRSPQSSSSVIDSRQYRDLFEVPDSEGEEVDGSASYVNTTKEVSSPSVTELSSLPTHQITSTLLSSADSAASSHLRSHPASPTVSIPETVPEPEREGLEDSIEDSQLQPQEPLPLQLQESRAIADTFEDIISTSQPDQQSALEKGVRPTAGSQADIDLARRSLPAQQCNVPNSEQQENLVILHAASSESSVEQQHDGEGRPEECGVPPLNTLAQAQAQQVDDHHSNDTELQQAVTSTIEPPEHHSLTDPSARGAIGAQGEPESVKQAGLQQNHSIAEDRAGTRLIPATAGPSSQLHLQPDLNKHRRVIEKSARPSVDRVRTAGADSSGGIASQPAGNSSFVRAIKASQQLQDFVQERPALHDLTTRSEQSSGSSQLQGTGASQSSSAISQESEQHAQAVIVESSLSTQNDFFESIRSTIEKEDIVASPHSRPQSRHDSSQESPLSSARSSPVSRPPSQSLGTTESGAPRRPATPLISSSLPRMADKLTHEDIQKMADAVFPKIRPGATPEPSSLLGTRSPSTIPDHLPQRQAPTLLGAAAMMKPPAATIISTSGVAYTQLGMDEVKDELSGGSGVATSPSAPVAMMSDEELTDADSDLSLLTDDLQLQSNEYIVPLPIDGRQASMYQDELKNKREMLHAFLNNPQAFERIDEVQKVLRRLKSIETHVDLTYEGLSSQEVGSLTQHQHQAQWSSDNSIKFRFLGMLLQGLRSHDMHVIIVIENEDPRLYGILESFLRGMSVDFKCPTRGLEADYADVHGKVSVTLLSKMSTPITAPPDIIICVDCYIGAAVHGKSWATNPDRLGVPVLYLVIPRAVDHIERYMAPGLTFLQQLHTTFAALAQLHSEDQIGQAIDSHTPKATDAACQVVAFLTPTNVDSSEWPLPSIGSIKEVIEFQSQASQKSIVSPQAPSAAKRPLGDELLDPAKRMRFTPQPRARPQSSENQEVTHVSDSLPGTATEIFELRLAIIDKDRELREHRGKEADWVLQQTIHEKFNAAYGATKRELESLTKQLEVESRKNTTLRERLDAKDTAFKELEARFREQQNALLHSNDEKIALVTKLRMETDQAKQQAERAKKNKDDMEATLKYTSDQYSISRDAATLLRQELDDARSEMATIITKASGQAKELAALHYAAQEKLVTRRREAHTSQLNVIKGQLQAREEENARLKMGRGVGVGTRAQSVGPAKPPRPNSRAASPLPVVRDRVANLRNG